MLLLLLLPLLVLVLLDNTGNTNGVYALNGATPKLRPTKMSPGWKFLEVVTQYDIVSTGAISVSPDDDDDDDDDDVYENENYWEMSRDFDGLGALLVDPGDDTNTTVLRFYINHETKKDSTISEVNVHLDKLKQILWEMRFQEEEEEHNNSNNNTQQETADGPSLAMELMLRGHSYSSSQDEEGTLDFVLSARQAFGRFSSDMGQTFTNTTRRGEIRFDNFCSGQSYEPNTFGLNRGFVDPLYIAGEEIAGGRLVVLDAKTRDLYQLSGVVGEARSLPESGNGGLPYDSFENAALLDTGANHTDLIALLLSADGGSESLQLYIGLKGRNHKCNRVKTDLKEPNILERNGLACGRWWYLTGSLPEEVGESQIGSFTGNRAHRLTTKKLEDIDTSPSDPTRVALTDEDDGVFIFKFDLQFSGGGDRDDDDSVFDPEVSSFEVQKVADRDCRRCFLDAPDNVEWTNPTTLGGIEYPEGILFVNEDNGGGAVVMMNPDGSNPRAVAKVTDRGASCGTFDISHLLGYRPASILVTSSMGHRSSLTIMINPDATLINPPNATLGMPPINGSSSPLWPRPEGSLLLNEDGDFHHQDMEQWLAEVSNGETEAELEELELELESPANRRALIDPYDNEEEE